MSVIKLIRYQLFEVFKRGWNKDGIAGACATNPMVLKTVTKVKADLAAYWLFANELMG